MASIDIAMPAYNRGPWIDKFMNSLLDQDFREWRLIARDDRSDDETAERLGQWQTRLGERMAVLPDSGSHNLGVIGNYNAVLSACTASWVMTADPDDIWLPSKIGMTVQAMRNAEARFGAATAISVCTDARVVDDALKPIAPSYWQRYRMNPQLAGLLPRTAMESVALGSTMMVNRALLELALPIETGSAYQDWWLALVAAAFGRTIALPEPTILYRRHGANETASPYIASLGAAIMRTLRDPTAPGDRMRSLALQAANQARSFVTRYRAQLDSRDLAALEALARLPSQNAVVRRLSVFRHGLWFGSPLKNLGLILLM